MKHLSDELEEVCDRLAGLHRELAQVEMAQLEARVNGWDQSPEETVTGRQRDADRMAMPLSVDALKLKGDIAALRERRHFITVTLEGT